MTAKKEELKEATETEKESNTTNTMSLYEKLQNCRVDLQKMNLKKTGENKFAGFKYYELADILPTINQLFLDYKLYSNFSICDDVAKLTIVNLENKEEKEVFESPIAEANIKGCTPVQSLGGIHTYLKRYLYINALEIVENDLFDSKTGDMEVEKSKPMTEEQKQLLNALSSETKAKIFNKYKTTNLTFKQASEALKNFKEL